MTNDTMSRIRAVQVRAVRVPMAHPHQTAGGTVSESPLVLTDVTTEDGVVGHSVVFTYTAAALKPTADLIRNLEPLIQGELLAPVEIEQKLSKRFGMHSREATVYRWYVCLAASQNQFRLTALWAMTGSKVPPRLRETGSNGDSQVSRQKLVMPQCKRTWR